MRQFGLADAAVLLDEDGRTLFGPDAVELRDLVDAAALLVNVAGNLRVDALKRRVRLAVYVDVDPGLTQLSLASATPSPRITGHDLYFTIGENVGRPGCLLPTSGLEWHHTRQPVLLGEWPVRQTTAPNRFTTIASWRGVGPHGQLAGHGFDLGLKADEFDRLIDLPAHVPQRCELALKLRPEDEHDRGRLVGHGWQVVDARTVASDPDAFRRYVQESGAEFSVAKGAYARTNSGWFSDRTTRYLASGKPALVQDTGFATHVEVGHGLLAFTTLDDAIAGARRIADHYEEHCQAARHVAETCFASDVVLTRFLEKIDTAR